MVSADDQTTTRIHDESTPTLRQRDPTLGPAGVEVDDHDLSICGAGHNLPAIVEEGHRVCRSRQLPCPGTGHGMWTRPRR